MQTILFVLIIVLGLSCYVVGIVQMLRGSYAPSAFSRAVWLLLAVNSLAGVVASASSPASIALAIVFLMGNAAMCAVSLHKGSREFGRIEYVSLALLMVSMLLWLVLDAPLVNLGISLFAHLVGGLPTLRKAWVRPESESASFWFLFFAASALTIVASNGAGIKEMLFPIYFTVFEGALFALTVRRYFTRRAASPGILQESLTPLD